MYLSTLRNVIQAMGGQIGYSLLAFQLEESRFLHFVMRIGPERNLGNDANPKAIR